MNEIKKRKTIEKSNNGNMVLWNDQPLAEWPRSGRGKGDWDYQNQE